MLTELKDITHAFSALEASLIVSITDAQGLITFVNEHFCEASKYEKTELIGKSHKMINSGYHSRAHFAELWKTIGRGQDEQSG